MSSLKSRGKHLLALPLLAVTFGCFSLLIYAETNSSALNGPLAHSRVFQWADMKAQPSNIGAFRNVFDSPQRHPR